MRASEYVAKVANSFQDDASDCDERPVCSPSGDTNAAEANALLCHNRFPLILRASRPKPNRTWRNISAGPNARSRSRATVAVSFLQVPGTVSP